MPVYIRVLSGLRPGSTPFYALINLLPNKILNFFRFRTLIPQMVDQCESGKRSTCSSCSKPTRVCLCVRLKTPRLDNSVAVTIFQHSLEKKHPLNSARIATLGLKNVDVISVSDVNFEARFLIRLLDANYILDSQENGKLVGKTQSESGSDDSVEASILGNGESGCAVTDFGGQCSKRSDFDSVETLHVCRNGTIWLQNSDVMINEAFDLKSGAVPNRDLDKAVDNRRAASQVPRSTFIDFTIEKHGVIRSFYNRTTSANKQQKVDIASLLASGAAIGAIGKGFIMKRLLRMPLDGSNEYQESEDFEVLVPPGSVLLFPSENSVGIDALDFEVRNLIVLDGTWAKAKRMYNENPWLKLLPHLRLDLDKSSLYSEVRHQPKAGYLSTIESIVYAMKALGQDSEGLDGLLHVFESMVGDQRRCKYERLKKPAEI